MPKQHRSYRKPRPKKRGFIFNRVLQRVNRAFVSVLVTSKTFVRQNRTAVWSGAIFGVCMLVFLFAYHPIASSQVMDKIMVFTAKATTFFVNLFGGKATTEGNQIFSSSHGPIEVIATDCTGLVPIAIFIAAVLAYPCRIRDKVWGILFGIITIYALNLVRTVSLFFIGTSFGTSSRTFDVAHFLVWQSLVIIISIVLWLLWAQKLIRVPAKQ